MSKILRKDTFRSVSANKLRFVSVSVIVALAFSFFVGIKSSAPQMRDNANEYFKNNNVADIRLTSDAGFFDDDFNRICSLKNVKYAVKSKFVDTLLFSSENAIVNSVGERLSCRVGTIDFSKAENFTVTQNSSDGYMNRLVLYDGKYPSNVNECVIDVNASEIYPTLKIGKTITVAGDGTTLDDSLNVTEFKIVGTVKSPLYISDTYSDTTVSTGTLSTFIYVEDDAFKIKRANEIFIKAVGSDYYDKFSDSYSQMIAELSGQLHSLSDKCNEDNSEKIKAEIIGEINSKKNNIEMYGKNSENDISSLEEKVKALSSEVSANKNKITVLNNKHTAEKQSAELNRNKISDELKTQNEALKKLTEQRDNLCSDSDGYSELKKDYNSLYSKHSSDRKTLEEKQKLYDEAKKEYENSKKKVVSLSNNISESKAKITKAEDDITSANALLPDLTNKKSSYSAQRNHVSSQINQIRASGGSSKAMANAQNELGVIDSKLAEINAQIDELTEKKENAEKTKKDCTSQIEKSGSELVYAKEKVKQSEKNFNSVSGSYNSFKEAFEKDEKNLNQLNQKIIDLSSDNTDVAKLNDSIDELNTKINDLKIQYANANIQCILLEKEYGQNLNNAEFDVADSENKLSINNRDLSNLKNKIQKNKNNLNGDLRRLTVLGEPTHEFLWNIVPLNRQSGFVSFLSAMENIRYTAFIFPLLFFIIAMISCFVIMIKNIDEDRQKIGIFKALGYSDASIILKYLNYSLLTWICGTAVGVPLGTRVIPRLVYSIYKSVFTIPEVTAVYNPWYLISGLLVSLFVVITASLWAVLRVIRFNPSELMLSDSKGFRKHSVIEYFPNLWDKLSYGMIISARTVARNRKRVLLGILGIMCCTAMVLTSFGLLNCASAVTSNQYGEHGAMRFDTQITSDVYSKELLKKAANDDRIEKAVYISVGVVSVSFNDGKANSVNLIVPEDSENFGDYIDIGKNNLDAFDVIITKGVADKLGISAGDVVYITDSASVKQNIKISAICDNYINDYIYINESAYSEIFGSAPEYNNILCKAKDYIKQADIDAFTAEYSEHENVLASSTAVNLAKEEQISIDRIRVLMIFFIGSTVVFSLIMLYTVSNLNLSQRIREVANIKVLGFSDHEALIYAMREITISTFFGIAAGIVFGMILHKLFVSFIQVDNVVYSGGISWWSFIASIGIIAFAALISAIPIKIKIKKINMAEALKEIE